MDKKYVKVLDTILQQLDYCELPEEKLKAVSVGYYTDTDLNDHLIFTYSGEKYKKFTLSISNIWSKIFLTGTTCAVRSRLSQRRLNTIENANEMKVDFATVASVITLLTFHYDDHYLLSALLSWIYNDTDLLETIH